MGKKMGMNMYSCMSGFDIEITVLRIGSPKDEHPTTNITVPQGFPIYISQPRAANCKSCLKVGHRNLKLEDSDEI